MSSDAERIGPKLCGLSLPVDVESLDHSLFLRYTSKNCNAFNEFELSYGTVGYTVVQGDITVYDDVGEDEYEYLDDVVKERKYLWDLSEDGVVRIPYANSPHMIETQLDNINQAIQMFHSET